MNNPTKLSWEKLLELDSPSQDSSNRNIPEKDYDKIIFSQAFRRLARKTQVHPLAVNDHVHNRMSHSLEVSTVGRSIISRLNKNNIIPDDHVDDCKTIVMAAGLGHDMGNPPFGHIGESAISKWVKNNSSALSHCHISPEITNTYHSYDGNAQNFHIFSSFEYFIDKPLSNPTIAAMVKYPVICSSENSKAGYFSFDEEKFNTCFNKLGLIIDGTYVRHPLSYVMEAADDICYGIMDIDDAIEMGFLQTGGTDFIRTIERIFQTKYDATHAEAFRKGRGIIIEKAIGEIADVFTSNFEKIMNGEIPKGHDLFKLSSDKETLEGIKEFKSLARNQIYKHRRKVKFEAASYMIISKILDNWLLAFTEYHKHNWDFKKCDPQSQKLFELYELYDIATESFPKTNNEGLIQAIDFVAGMTDRYAKEMGQTLSGSID